MVVLALSILGGVAALAVDFGSYAGDRRDLQNAADAISLAAAQELPSVSAVNATANTWATKNGVDPANMTVTVIPQNLPLVPNPGVKVTVTRTHHFTFARMVGITSQGVGATATSIRTSPGGHDGLVPWSVTHSVLTLVPPGNTAVLKYDSNNVTSGNFGAVRIDGNGAQIYEQSATYGSDNGLCATGIPGCPYPSVIGAETGNIVGGTRDAVDYRMTHTSTACDTWAEVTLIQAGKVTLNPACNPFVTGSDPNSLRIIIIPVVSDLCNGSCNLTITEFALFFLEGYAGGGCNGNHCDIQGRFIEANINFGAQVGVFNASTLSHFVRLTQ